MKTAELIGIALDYWVSKAEEQNFSIEYLKIYGISYSTEWSYGGPIIERERIAIFPNPGTGRTKWEAQINSRQTYDGVEGDIEMLGETALIAAMRAFAASRFGDEIDDPEGICNE